jgi:hypothetical protein
VSNCEIGVRNQQTLLDYYEQDLTELSHNNAAQPFLCQTTELQMLS